MQALLAEFRDAGATHVAMEVSSHALEQGRVNAVAFEVAVFTNLTRDHLDYHGTMEAYGAAKAKLFAWPGLRAAVINIDDAFGRELADAACRADGDAACATASTMPMRKSSRAMCAAAAKVCVSPCVTPWGEGEIATPLLGRFNVANLLAVAGCLGALGFTFAQIHKR